MVWAQDRYAGDEAKAEAIARAMDADRIWPRLTVCMAREPVSDVLITPNGGDGALDIYLVRPPPWWIPIPASDMPHGLDSPHHPAPQTTVIPSDT